MGKAIAILDQTLTYSTRPTKAYVIKYKGKVISGYNGKHIFNTKGSASASATWLCNHNKEMKEEFKQLKKDGIVTIEEIDLNRSSLTEEEIIDKYIQEKLK